MCAEDYVEVAKTTVSSFVIPATPYQDESRHYFTVNAWFSTCTNMSMRIEHEAAYEIYKLGS